MRGQCLHHLLNNHLFNVCSKPSTILNALRENKVYKAIKKYRNNLKQDRTWKTICSSGKIMDLRPKLEFLTLFTRCVAWNK